MDDLSTILPAHIPLKWVILIAPLFILIAWHHYQHLYLQSLSRKPTASHFKEMFTSLRWRGGQVAAIWVISVLLVMYGDIRYYRLLAQVEALGLLQEEDAPAENELEPLDFSSAPAAPPAAEAAAPDPDTLETKLDELKFRYEDAFVSYFYLQRCKQADITDLAHINEALAAEVKSIGAPADVQYSIYSAAQGSFESIYADTPCNPAYLNPVMQQFKGFMQKIR